MSIERRGLKWQVRWYSNGHHYARTFSNQADAEAFETKVHRRKQVGRASKSLHLFDQSEMGEEVYVVRGGAKVKIGVSINTHGRMLALRTASPLPLEIVWRIACPNASKLEKALHRRYAEHHSHGEWFDAEPVLADLKGLAELGSHQFSPTPYVHNAKSDQGQGHAATG